MARRLAKRWIRQGDFLLQPREEPFTNVAANLPYLRWSRIPTKLSKLYENIASTDGCRRCCSAATPATVMMATVRSWSFG